MRLCSASATDEVTLYVERIRADLGEYKYRFFFYSGALNWEGANLSSAFD